MYTRSFIDKSNTLISGSLTNTAFNPIIELFYGGNNANEPQGFTRHVMHVDFDHLVDLYNTGYFPDLSKFTHTLRMTSTSAFDKELLEEQYVSMDRASGFDLILSNIPDSAWTVGVGMDYSSCNSIAGTAENYTSSNPSNYFYAQTAIPWQNGYGCYTGTPVTITTQHFDLGSENVNMDITDTVNGIITGDTHNGFCLAYSSLYEQLQSAYYQYYGLFGRYTELLFEPYIESYYSDYINDDRLNFYLDKTNKLYLYTNIGNTPTDLDNIPACTVYDNNGNIYSSFTSSNVTKVSKGVYCIELIVHTTSAITDCLTFTDTWSGITINSIARSNVSMDIVLKDSEDYYNIGNNDEMPQKHELSIHYLKNGEKIVRGDIR